MKAVFYARVSTKEQVEDKESLPYQVDGAQHRIEAAGHELVDSYIDAGLEGWKRDRPEYVRLIHDGLARKYDVLYAKDFDRLGRHRFVAGDLQDIIEAGIEVVGWETPIYPQMLGTLSDMAWMDNERRRNNSRMGHIRRAKDGKWCGSPPYGCRYNDKGELEIEPTEAYWYRQMFNWCIDGLGDEKIARRLTLEVSTRKGGKGWTAPYVSKLLRNPSAYGEGHFRPKVGEPVTVAVPPVVDKTTFDLAQRARASRRNFACRPTNRVYLVRPTKIRCAECKLGFRLISRSSTVRRRLAGGRTKVYPRKVLSPVLICRGLDMYPHLYQCRDPKHLMFDRIAERVWDYVAGMIAEESFYNSLYPDEERANKLTARLQEIERRIETTERELQFIVTKGRQGIIPEQTFDIQMKHLCERLEAEKAESESVLSEIKGLGKVEDIEAAGEALALLQPERHLEDLNALPLEEKAKLVDTVVERVDINKDGKLTLYISIPMLTRSCRQRSKAS